MPRASKSGVRGLYRGADGTYRIDLRWRDPVTGKAERYREKLPPKTNATAAKNRAREILSSALAGTFDPNREAPTTLRAALDRYLTHCETHGIASTRSRRTHALAICSFFGDKRPLEELTGFDVERLKAHLRAKTRTVAAKPARKAKDGTVITPSKPARKLRTSPGTVNRHITTFKAFAAWATTEGLLDRGRAAALRDVKLLREPEGRVRWLSDDELQKVHTKLGGWLKPIVLTAIGTGARRTEIAGLRWRDVDRDHGELVLRRTKNRKVRNVPISPGVLEIIDAQPKGEPNAYVFHVPSRAARIDNPRRSDEERRGDVVSKAWSRFCEAHELADLHVHDLRHHAATTMRRAGHGLDVVAAVLGHSDVRVASRYAHLGRSDIASAVGAAAASLEAKPESVAQPLPTGTDGDQAKGSGS